MYDLCGKIVGILDDGLMKVGVEFIVLDFLIDKLVILWFGVVMFEVIEWVIGMLV